MGAKGGIIGCLAGEAPFGRVAPGDVSVTAYGVGVGGELVCVRRDVPDGVMPDSVSCAPAVDRIPDGADAFEDLYGMRSLAMIGYLRPGHWHLDVSCFVDGIRIEPGVAAWLRERVSSIGIAYFDPDVYLPGVIRDGDPAMSADYAVGSLADDVSCSLASSASAVIASGHPVPSWANRAGSAAYFSGKERGCEWRAVDAGTGLSLLRAACAGTVPDSMLSLAYAPNPALSAYAPVEPPLAYDILPYDMARDAAVVRVVADAGLSAPYGSLLAAALWAESVESLANGSYRAPGDPGRASAALFGMPDAMRAVASGASVEDVAGVYGMSL